MSFSGLQINDGPSDFNNSNIDNASIKEKVEELTSFIDSCKFGMLTTRNATTGALVSRCMLVAAKENGGIDLVFYTNTVSEKINDIDNDPRVNISFLDSSGQWASISGTSDIITDRDVVKKYYLPSLKGWIGDLGDGIHDGGPEDPRISAIRLETEKITYAVTRKNALARGIEVAQGVVTGKIPAGYKMREINQEEVVTWRYSRQIVE